MGINTYVVTVNIFEDQRNYKSKQELLQTMLDRISSFIGETAYAVISVEEFDEDGYEVDVE